MASPIVSASAGANDTLSTSISESTAQRSFESFFMCVSSLKFFGYRYNNTYTDYANHTIKSKLWLQF